ncbi:MAG: hypothetical protein M3198_07920 [Actinomycetota bacterium]|nr:hypothetical protein [Actinomycetota bacterium]
MHGGRSRDLAHCRHGRRRTKDKCRELVVVRKEVERLGKAVEDRAVELAALRVNAAVDDREHRGTGSAAPTAGGRIGRVEVA